MIGFLSENPCHSVPPLLPGEDVCLRGLFVHPVSDDLLDTKDLAPFQTLHALPFEL